MQVRAYRPDDEADVRRVVADAFGDEGATVAALAEDLRDDARAGPSSWRTTTAPWSGTCC